MPRIAHRVLPKVLLPGLSFGIGLLLSACRDAPTAVIADLPSPQKNQVCVRESSEGGAPDIQPYNPSVGCPAGFDLKIWY
jgi:hypothetical protein